MKGQLFFFGVLLGFLTIAAWASDPLHSVAANASQCECFNDNCGCCEYIDMFYLGINGTVCTNFSYLPLDIGVAVTVTYNSRTLFNETISARNPPPVCFGIPDLEKMHAHICVRLYDLTFREKTFHGCGKLIISVYRVIHKSIDLGCVNIPKRSFKDVYRTYSREIFDFVRYHLEYLDFRKGQAPVVNMI